MLSKTRLLLIPTFAAGFLAASPMWATTAAAVSEDCTSWSSNSGQTGNVKCDSDSAVRHHRAVVTCMNSGGAKWKITGPWRSRNHVSSATCSTTGTAGVYAISVERNYHG